MRIIFTLKLLVFILLFVFISSTAYAKEQQLLGRWEKPDGSYIEFLSNGIALGGDPNILKAYVQEGTYSLKDDTIHLVFDIPWWLNWAKRDVDQVSRYYFETPDVLIFENLAEENRIMIAKFTRATTLLAQR